MTARAKAKKTRPRTRRVSPRQLTREHDAWYCIVVAGSAGCGKTETGKFLADQLGAIFRDADEFHTRQAEDKMAAKIPLTNAERDRWVERIVGCMIDNRLERRPLVVTCSALRRKHRRRFERYVSESLIPGGQVFVVWLDVEKEVLEERIRKRYARGNHFFPPELLASQLEAIQKPDPKKESYLRVVKVRRDDTVVDVGGCVYDKLPEVHAFSTERLKSLFPG